LRIEALKAVVSYDNVKRAAGVDETSALRPRETL
jgi:hypothetical protein